MFTFKGYAVGARLILTVVGVLALIVGTAMFVRSCDSRHNRAAQGRVEASQAQAASNSAADAIGAVARSGEAERASEDLTRTNEQQIRAAEGSNAAVNPAARDAGIAALCRRQAYANDPRCKR